MTNRYRIARAVRFNKVVVCIIRAALTGKPIVSGSSTTLAAVERCSLLSRRAYTDDLSAKFPNQQLFEVYRYANPDTHRR